MSSRTEDLAMRLTTNIAATPGVSGLFPQSLAGAAAASFVHADRPTATGIVTLDQTGERLAITARIAIDSGRAASQVTSAVAATIRRDLRGDPFVLHLEIAQLLDLSGADPEIYSRRADE